MLLYEFDQNSALIAKIVALTNQLEQEIKDGDIPEDITVDDLLDFFQSYDVILDVNDLYNMIRVLPLKSIIKNIQGDKVVFVGQEETKAEKPAGGDEEKVVKQMAKRAMKF